MTPKTITIGAAVLTLAATGVILAINPGDVTKEPEAQPTDDSTQWACVIPDCRDGDGKWNERHAAVDCLRMGTLPTAISEATALPTWIGCNAFPAKVAKGTACLPSPCKVWSGSAERAHTKALRASDGGTL